MATTNNLYVCNICQKHLDEGKFSATDLARAKKNNKATCKQCVRGKYILKTYGISLEDYETMYREQNQSCKICLKKFKPGISAHVDHNHETGAVRGLLCLNCNTGIGKLEDSAVTCIAAAVYLLTTDESTEADPQLQTKLEHLRALVHIKYQMLSETKNTIKASSSSPSVSQSEEPQDNMTGPSDAAVKPQKPTTPEKVQVSGETANLQCSCNCQKSKCGSQSCGCKKKNLTCTKECHGGLTCENK